MGGLKLKEHGVVMRWDPRHIGVVIDQRYGIER